MKAIQTTENAQDPIALVNLSKPKVGEGKVLVKMKAAALNRRDQWIREGLYPGIKPGVTLGSDGCGIVMEGDDQLKGHDVIINPNIDWGPSERAQAAEYTILGLPYDGTLAEYVVVARDKVFRKPSHLSIYEAAALPLAGMTAFRALFTRGEVQKGHKVLVTGAGGGVSQFAILFAQAVGAKVFVTSGSDDKIKKMVASGVEAGFNYKDKEWVKKAKGAVRDGFDAVIDSAGGDSLNDYIRLIKPGGNIVHYGATTGKPSNVDLFRLFWSQANIKGSTMATDDEFARMVDFVEKHKLQPQVDSVYELEDFIAAFDRIKSTQHIGKIVLNIA